MSKKKNTAIPEKVKIIFLGGLEQIGMNITAFECGDSIIVVDCGMAFPDEETPGIDLVIPDISYLRENREKVRGFFITHGHEDHIGALPYVLSELNVPVYGTKLTMALIGNKLEEKGILSECELHVVSFGDTVTAGSFGIEFIKTNHSIQDAAALAIHTPCGTIIHTGDFKVDYTPVYGDPIDLQRFAELGKEGVLALLCDSTNAIRQGFTMSESTVGKTFDSIFAKNREKRIIVATFASNVDRVQQIINYAEEYGRKVCIDGRSMVNVINTAAELGYIKVKADTLIDIGAIRDYPPEKMVLIATGSQGETTAALSRMAAGQHKRVSITADDVIVLSSTPIPGNEKAVARVINELSRKQAKVIYSDTHVSGHACEEEIKLIYSLVRPRFSIPVHGEYRHRLCQRDIAELVGIDDENVLIADTGDVLELTRDTCEIVDHIDAGPVMVDGLIVGDVGNAVLRDRQSLSQNGVLTVCVALDGETGEIVSGPQVMSKGFVYVRESEDLMEDTKNVVIDTISSVNRKKKAAPNVLRSRIREDLQDYIWRRMKRSPEVIAMILEV